MIHLDGSTLEGGGQLVRNAVALSALTSQPVKISKIRFGRQGSRGLRPSHTAAIQCLLDICGGTAENVRVGSSEITFYPRGQKGNADSDHEANVDVDDLTASLKTLKLNPITDVLPVQPEYSVRLSTPGSVVLIFQALYPYLLYAASCANARAAADGESPLEGIKVKIAGGTNVSYAPSYDYISQVLVPNFAKLGLPPIDVELKHRGWSAGQANTGAVSFFIRPLETCKESSIPLESVSVCNSAPFSPIFPEINLQRFERGRITQIDITVFAPDTPFDEVSSAKDSKSGKKREKAKKTKQADGHSVEENLVIESDPKTPAGSPKVARKRPAPHSIREFVENYALEAVSRVFSPKAKRSLNIQLPKTELHYSEETRHYSRTCILLVAHTSTGFRLGRDVLYGDQSTSERKPNSHDKIPSKVKGKGKAKGTPGAKSKLKTGAELQRTMEDMIDRCVDDLMHELADGENARDLEKVLGDDGSKRYLDSMMRDQVVIFQALGKLGAVDRGGGDTALQRYEEKDLSLHTQTAMWVCKQMLGVSVCENR